MRIIDTRRLAGYGCGCGIGCAGFGAAEDEAPVIPVAPVSPSFGFFKLVGLYIAVSITSHYIIKWLTPRSQS